MGGLRARKNTLIVALRFLGVCGKLTKEQVDGFELMYRRASSAAEQDKVTAALRDFMEGWKDAGAGGAKGGVYGHLRRLRAGIDLYTEEEDDDPPALREAIARSRVVLRRT